MASKAAEEPLQFKGGYKDESEYHQTPWVTNTVPAEDEGKYEGKAAEDIFSAAGSKRRAEDDPVSMDAKQTSSTQLTISADHQEGRALHNMMRFTMGPADDKMDDESVFAGMMEDPKSARRGSGSSLPPVAVKLPDASSSQSLSYRALDDGHGMSSDASDDGMEEDDEENAENALVPDSQPEVDQRMMISCVPMAPQTHFRGLESVDGQRRRRLLIVDDTRTIRTLLNRVFEKNGFEVDTAPNGKFALGMMQNRVYDLVFLDIEMPVMNGYRCAQYIRSWEQHVQRADRQRICALSSHDTEDEQQLAQQSGMDAFQSKPTPVNVLLEYLHNLFGKQNKNALFNVGDMVEVRDKQTQMRLWFPGSIQRVNTDGTYDVISEDGSTELRVRETRIRKPMEAPEVVSSDKSPVQDHASLQQ
mmetsp:Transcript_22296/g.51519  ORF Transcript_22296/g.51519 Transcript_22296/m.51519 type:complete len:417 (-) Transcript_22296:197-1447(-)